MKLSSSSVWFRTGLAAILIATFCLAGCTSKGGKTQKVVGKVTYGGEPLGGGKIFLAAVGEHPQTFETAIKPDGSFDLAGVPPGEYNVGVETESIKAIGSGGGMYNTKNPQGGPPGGTKEQPKFEGANMPRYVQIPPKYRDPKTSGLPTITVQSGSKEAKNIDLPK